MSEALYNNLFKQALQKIKGVRNPHASKPELLDLKWETVRNQVLFDFGGNEHEKYERMAGGAKAISISCLQFMIQELGKKYGHDFEVGPIPQIPQNSSEVLFSLVDRKNRTLLLFKEIEECCMWKLRDKEPEEIAHILNKESLSNCVYVYLVHDYAYLQIIGHNDDVCDPGRGYNFYGIKWFFETYFGTEEYLAFSKALEIYMEQVCEYIGYTYIKTLGSNALINFRKITEHEITHENYDVLLKKVYKDENNKRVSLSEKDYQKIKEQYFNERTMLILLGKHDFAESLITAEWLYSSMKKAKAIDLTVIGTGYFKTIEQLLYELICLHKNEGRVIKKNKSKDKVSLNEINIKKEGVIDSTLGSMAYFYKENMDMLRDDLKEAKAYVREAIFEYVKVRNGYFHKQNIHSWNKIEEIRKETFCLLFLILGSHQLTNDERSELGQLSKEEFDDYYKLCEYVNYHSDEFFYLDFGNRERLVISCLDFDTETIEDEYVSYSGVYFREVGKGGRTYRFTKESLPDVIYSGKLVFGRTELVTVEPQKVKKIFENGKFIGPSIVDEDKFSY